jgi:WD40 repeat protein
MPPLALLSSVLNFGGVLPLMTDKTARLWDAATGKQVAVLRAADADAGHGFGDRLTMFFSHDGWVTSAAFSPDGARVVTSEDKTARLWDVGAIPKATLFQIACTWLPDHDLTDIARDYGLTNLQPICEYDPPLADALPN